MAKVRGWKLLEGDEEKEAVGKMKNPNLKFKIKASRLQIVFSKYTSGVVHLYKFLECDA